MLHPHRLFNSLDRFNSMDLDAGDQTRLLQKVPGTSTFVVTLLELLLVLCGKVIEEKHVEASQKSVEIVPTIQSNSPTIYRMLWILEVLIVRKIHDRVPLF